ncbi:MAG: helix-turn-helix transcriptional regulator [Candidatus Shapirobacteria bacterium]|jgi:DNA-binding XRE family transcriptional regulator
MARNINKLTTLTQLDKKLSQDKAFKRASSCLDLQFQLTQKLIELRLKHQLSQLQLAKKIGSQQPAISRLESGNSKPNFSMLERIAKATNTKLEINFT